MKHNLHPDLQHQLIPTNRQCMVHIYWPTNDQLLFSAAFIQTNLHWRVIPKKWRTTKMLKLPWRASHSCNCCRWSCLICHCSKRWLGNSCLETTICSSDEHSWRWLHNCVMLNWEIKNTSDKYSSWYPEKQDRVNVVITSVVSGFQQLCSKTKPWQLPNQTTIVGITGALLMQKLFQTIQAAKLQCF